MRSSGPRLLSDLARTLAPQAARTLSAIANDLAAFAILARQTEKETSSEPGECPHGYTFDTCTQCHDAFHAGKAEEREACAKLALTAAIDEATNGAIHCDQIGRAVAKAIRARGSETSSRQGHPRAGIRDEQDLDEVLEEIETILDSEPGTPEYERLQALSLLVEKFEEDKFPAYKPPVY